MTADRIRLLLDGDTYRYELRVQILLVLAALLVRTVLVVSCVSSHFPLVQQAKKHTQRTKIIFKYIFSNKSKK